MISLMCNFGFAEDFKLQGDVEMNIQQEIQQEISSDMDEVKMWMSLYDAVEKQYINIKNYPPELERYMIHQSKIIEEYLILIEDAEVLYYDGGDYKAKIEEAKKKLSTLKILRQIFDEYVWYKENERSQTKLQLSVEAIKSGKAIPMMHRIAYTVLRGEYPVEVLRVDGVVKSLDTHEFTYKNGDTVIFKRGRLIEVIQSE